MINFLNIIKNVYERHCINKLEREVQCSSTYKKILFKTKRISMVAIKLDPNCILFTKVKTLEMYDIAVKGNPFNWKLIPEELKSKEFILNHIRLNPSVITSQLISPDLQIQEEIIRVSPESAVLIDNIDDNIAKKSFKSCADNYMLVTNPSYEDSLCYAKFSKNFKITLLPNEHLTEELLKIAIEKNPKEIYFLEKELQEDDLCKIALNKGGYKILKLLRNPSFEVCLHAVSLNFNAISLIENPEIQKRVVFNKKNEAVTDKIISHFK